MPDYFLISVSNKHNLKLCIKYALAGFTNSVNGLWTFLDIETEDYISFLYGARVFNLYKVIKKEAYKNAENLPPWSPITFKISGKTYYFPFRLHLKQERELSEPMVRPEFSYVAENLLLRGGYRKTHFQADAITFYNVSNMGSVYNNSEEKLEINEETFIPKIVFNRKKQKIPWKFYFQELILQSLVRKKIKELLREILNNFNLNLPESDFEILGEKALPEGFVDIFIKLKHPKGSNIYLLVEVKTGKAQRKDFEQLKSYIKEFGNECKGGILIAKEFPRKNIKINSDILLIKYGFDHLDKDEEYSYSQLMQKLNLEVVKRK
jgi:RecB family endonuclease NucS